MSRDLGASPILEARSEDKGDCVGLLRSLRRRIERPIWKRIAKQIEPRISFADSRLNRLEASWAQQESAFLGCVATLEKLRLDVARTGRELQELRRDQGALLTEAQSSVRDGIRSVEDRIQVVEDRIQVVDGRIPDLEGRFRGFEEPLREEFQNLEIRSGENIAKLWERIEFVRREIFYEMAYGASGGRDKKVKAQGRIINEEKLSKQRREDGIRLNLGCGHIPLQEYVNVDMRDLDGVDIVADASDIPVEAGSIREIFSSHMLEHFPQEDMKRRLLPYWHGLLAENGVFRAIVPDGEAMLREAGSGAYPFEDFREVLFGAQDYDGDFHYNLFTPDSLRELLMATGFHEVTIPVRGRRNGKCFEFEILAIRK